MDVRCERCKTEYELNDAQVTEAGVPVKCTSCGYVFRVKRKALAVTVPLKPDDASQASPLTSQPESKEPAARGRTWRIRQAEGSVVLLKELTTLQRWIVEKKVGRDDQISLTGETWKKLGEIPELGPFFQVVEDAALGHQLLRKQALADSVPPASGPSSVPLDPANPFPRAASGEHPSIPPFAQSLAPQPLVTPGEFAIPARVAREPSTESPREPARPVRSAARRDEAELPSELALDFNRSRRRGSRLIIVLLLLMIAGGATYALGLWQRVPLLRDLLGGAAPGSTLDAGVTGAAGVDAVDSRAAAVDAGSPVDAGSASVEAREPSTPLPSVVATGSARAPGADAGGAAAPGTASLQTARRAAAAGGHISADGVQATGVPPPVPAPGEAPRVGAAANASEEPAGTPGSTTGGPTAAKAVVPEAAPAPDDAARPQDALPDVAPAVPLTPGAVTADAGTRAAAPRDFDFYMTRGDRLRQRDHAAAAMDAYGRAVDLSPDRAEGYAGRGLALLDQGNQPLAEASFQQALKLNPRYSVALMGLAETYRVMGKKPEAIRYYQKFLDVVPSGTEASAARAAIQKLRD